ncbi:hypothetical protein [Streptomyces sp. NPDC002588]|uniref:hypothetical protein n=1 Tax=Streptomyces sp. NPDC002588 TaxID=3154419 RepID=UPI0033314C8E
MHSRPEDGLQHIRVKDDGGGMALHMFFRGTDPGETSLRLERLMRSVQIIPVLQAYRRLDVPADAAGPATDEQPAVP